MASVTRVHTILTGIADNLCGISSGGSVRGIPFQKGCKILRALAHWPPLSSGPAHSMFSHAYTTFPYPGLRFLRSIPPTFDLPP